MNIDPELELILLDISNAVLIEVSYSNIKNTAYNEPSFINILFSDTSSIIESVKIMPTYPQLKYFYSFLVKPNLRALNGLSNNICFLDTIIDDKLLVISCDWCSLVNGVLETLKQNIIKDENILKYIDIEKIRILNSLLNWCLNARENYIKSDTIEKWCVSTFGKNSPQLLIISELYLKAEILELRWCPFKRSKEFYYRNKDSRYVIPTQKNIYNVGEILTKHETITCNNCPKLINDNWQWESTVDLKYI